MSLHVAIASVGFPPIRHVCGTRAGRMARELAARGNQVSVVTVDWRSPAGAEHADEHGVHVMRVNPRAWFDEFDPNQRPLRLERDPFPLARRARTAFRTLRWGPFAPWARWAVDALTARHLKAPIDIVWAIHGDDSAHEIGFRFHRKSGVPWVADFKDPWDQFHMRGMRIVQKAITSRRIRSAECMTNAAEVQARDDERTFGKASHVIWTSYDHMLLASCEPKRCSDAFSMLYVGHFGEKHDLRALADTLRLVRLGANGAKLEFHVFGHAADVARKHLDEAGVGDMLRAHEFVPQAEAYSLMRGADALLLLPTTNHAVGVAVGVKELEYFASGSPVVSIGRLLPEMNRLTERLPCVAQAETVRGASRILLEELAHHIGGTPSSRRCSVNPPALLEHTWAKKAEEFERILATAAGLGERVAG